MTPRLGIALALVVTLLACESPAPPPAGATPAPPPAAATPTPPPATPSPAPAAPAATPTAAAPAPTVATPPPAAAGTPAAAKLAVTSTAFAEGQTIPKLFTCDDRDVSPPLSFAGVPPQAKSLALIVDDPDAPMGTWVHWVLFGLPPDQKALPQAYQPKGPVKQGKNSFGKVLYGGPCPPSGPPHRYFFRLYALDRALDLKAGASRADVDTALKGHVLAEATLMGRYGRAKK